MHWGGKLLTSGGRLVVLWFFLKMRLITIENAHDLPSFCDELSVGFREISALAQVVSPNGLFVERTGFRACSEASGGFGNLCGPAIGGSSGAHDLSIFSGTDFIK